MNYYQRRKDEIRQEAIDWLDLFHGGYSELVNWQYYFYLLGKRYGLLREFKENGIL